ncbi:MAG: 30S ribosomal protein S6 [Chitinophagales bacterium]|nr:30S ribosomal protein S6 [Bacteroidota bacterium]MCB9256595.1 30S ribosomal protein S6 [Chitinophagales bacterium]
MNQYETTFIVTPVLSDEDVKKTVKEYTDFLVSNGAEIVEEAHWGLKQMAYPIKKKTTGIYHHIEYRAASDLIDKFELSLRRDESIMRFLSVKLDKYSKKYNDDKRAGLVGRNKKKQEPKTDKEA